MIRRTRSFRLAKISVCYGRCVTPCGTKCRVVVPGGDEKIVTDVYNVTGNSYAHLGTGKTIVVGQVDDYGDVTDENLVDFLEYYNDKASGDQKSEDQVHLGSPGDVSQKEGIRNLACHLLAFAGQYKTMDKFPLYATSPQAACAKSAYIKYIRLMTQVCEATKNGRC